MVFKTVKRWFQRNRSAQKPGFYGDYPDWEAATAASTGYDTLHILEQTRQALGKVVRGEAAYERDSVTFDRIQHSFPLLACLMRTGIKNGGRLSVLDFGGALGSSYYQCKNFLAPIKDLRWSVVEQPAHVECGEKEFQTDTLRFYRSVKECILHEQPNVLLLSSVLQYLPAPHSFLRELLAYKIPSIILDRTTFLEADRDRITVQVVPPRIYKGSYPAWFFGETAIRGLFKESHYDLILEFDALDKNSPSDEPAYCKGFLYEKDVIQ